IRHCYPRSKRQRAMGGCIAAGIECLAARSPPPREIEGRDDKLPRTSSARFGVREKPIETPTVSLRRRRDQPRNSQSKDAKRWTNLDPLRLTFQLSQNRRLNCGKGEPRPTTPLTVIRSTRPRTR